MAAPAPVCQARSESHIPAQQDQVQHSSSCMARLSTAVRVTTCGFHEGRFAKVSQGDVNYKLWGRGDGVRPLVVTIHGLMGSLSTFASMAKTLVTFGYDVLTFDLFGFGLSDAPDSRFDARTYAKQTIELLSHIGYPEGSRFHLIGYSMGGLVAIELATQMPERIERLVLVAPAGLVPLSLRERTGVRALRMARALRIPVVSIAAKLANTRGWDQESFEPDGASQHVSRECAEVNERRFRSDPQKFITSWLKSVRDMKLAGSRRQYVDLRKTGVDVMFVWGDSDQVVPLCEKTQEELRGIFPDAPVAVLTGVGHGMLVEHSDVVANLAARWFRSGRQELPIWGAAPAGCQ